jgi:acetyl esterase
MNMQLAIIDLLRGMPRPFLRMLAGKPASIDGNTLDLNMHMMAKLAARGASDDDAPMSVAAFRAAASAYNGLNLPVAKGVTTSDTAFALLGNNLQARVYRPATLSGPLPAVLFFHQGGLVIMDHLTDDHFCSLLAARCKAVVISLDYRLCPEHAFPAPIEDAEALWHHVQENAVEMNIDPERIALAGDSAGGLISSSLAISLRDSGGTQPAAMCLAYPWVTTNNENQPSLSSCANAFPLTADTMHFFNEQVFPNDREKDSALANPLHVEDLGNLPPTVIGTAGFDPIRDQGNAFAQRLIDAGNEVEHFCFKSLTHSYLMFGRVSRAAEEACEQLASSLSKVLNRTD